MDLKNRYAAKSSKELIIVLETPDDYQPEVLKIVEEELKSRNEPYEKLTAIAEYFQRERIAKMLNELDPLNDELKLPSSHFLSKEEMKAILIEEFEKLLERKDGFRFDVWKYSIGGI